MTFFDQYGSVIIHYGTNILLAIVILILGYWVAGRVGRFVTGLAETNMKNLMIPCSSFWVPWRDGSFWHLSLLRFSTGLVWK